MYGSLGPAIIGVFVDGVGIRTGIGILALATVLATAVAAVLFAERVFVPPASLESSKAG